MLYVFVDIDIDVEHLVATIKLNFEAGCKLGLLGTIQFSSAVHAARLLLLPMYPDLLVPQARPLSKGEVLGCTCKIFGEELFVLSLYMFCSPLTRGMRRLCFRC